MLSRYAPKVINNFSTVRKLDCQNLSNWSALSIEINNKKNQHWSWIICINCSFVIQTCLATEKINPSKCMTINYMLSFIAVFLKLIIKVKFNRKQTQNSQLTCKYTNDSFVASHGNRDRLQTMTPMTSNHFNISSRK